MKCHVAMKLKNINLIKKLPQFTESTAFGKDLKTATEHKSEHKSQILHVLNFFLTK